MKNSDLTKGHSFMFISMLFSSLNYIALRFLLPKWMTGIDATFFRLTGAMILFWITSLFIKNTKVNKHDAKIIFLSGLFLLFPSMLTSNLAIQYSSVIDVSIIMTTPPVIVAIASIFIYKTKISFLNGLGLFLSMGGAVFLIVCGQTHQKGEGHLLGNLFAIISACTYGFYILSLKPFANRYSPSSLLRWIFLSSSIGAIPLGIIFLDKAPIMHHPDLMSILAVAFIIIFPSFFSFLLIPPAMKRIGHQMVSMYMDIIPIVVTALTVILKMDKLYWSQPVAIIIILSGVYISSRAVQKDKNQV